jgi:tetratricopeptide (TPR) repeat protein
MSEPRADWRDIYCGRGAELDRLEQAYRDVAAGDGPRLAVILGDRGIGKTRLVQEFYRRLTTGHDPHRYWPDAALFRGNNLRVAPDVRDDPDIAAHFAQFKLDERPMPFLWWGFRLADPTDRNAIRTDLAAHRRFLEPHLTPLFFAREDAALRREIKAQGAIVGWNALYKAVASIPLVGLLASLLTEGVVVGRDYARTRTRRQHLAQRRAQARADALAREQTSDIVEATLRDLAAVLGPSQEMATIPVIVFVDDAQFACPGGDEGALRLAQELWSRAHAAHWPLLMVATHWESVWHQVSATGGETFAGHFAPLMARLDAQWQPVVLRAEPDIGAMVDSGLPGLHPHDKALLLDKAGGNPQLLVEIIGKVLRAPAWRSADGALTPGGRAAIAGTTFDLHRMIIERMHADTTPAGVRSALALSAVQGVEFLSGLTEAAAVTLGLAPVEAGLAQAAHPHRYIARTGSGVAAFAQRAYRDAALALLEQEVGEPAAVEAAVLAATHALMDDPERWPALRHDAQLAALGVCASLGESSPRAADRLRAARTLVSLIEDALSQANARDFARGAQLAVRLERGLREERWRPADFDLAHLDQAFRAIAAWYGPQAGEGLATVLVEHARALLAERADAQARRDLSVSYNRLGEVAQASGQLDAAAQAFAQARALRETLAVELGTPDARRDLALSHLAAGEVAHARGRLEEAAGALDQARALCAVLAADGPTPQARRDLAACEERLGELARARGALDEAQRRCVRALEIHTALARELGTPAARRDLSVSHNRAGELARARGRLAEAGRAFEQAHALREALAAEVGTPEARRDLALSCMHCGDLAQARGHADEATRHLERAHALCAALAREVGTPQARRDFSVSCDRLGELARSCGKPDTAQGWFGRALALDEALARELGTPEARRDLSVSENRLGELARARGQLDEAARRFGAALALREALVREQATPEARRDLALSHLRLGEVAHAGGRFGAAAHAFGAAHALCVALEKDLATPVARRDLAMCSLRLGEIAQERGRLDEAAARVERASALYMAVDRALGTAGARRDLALCVTKAGEIAFAQGAQEVAAAYFEQALALGASAGEGQVSPDAPPDLSRSYARVGDVALARGRLDEAERNFTAAVALREALVQAAPTREARRSLAEGYERLGDLARAAGRRAEAQQWLAKALATVEPLVQEPA